MMIKRDNGYAKCWSEWVGKYANCHFDYFARHQSGPMIDYDFNSLGYRGAEHWTDPDINIFGSSFGVGVTHEECWQDVVYIGTKYQM